MTEQSLADRQQILKQAVDDAGGAVAVGAMIELTRHAVYDFIRRGQFPAEHCPVLERKSGGVLRCEVLNTRVDWAYLRDQVSPSQEGSAAENDSPDAWPPGGATSAIACGREGPRRVKGEGA